MTLGTQLIKRKMPGIRYRVHGIGKERRPKGMKAQGEGEKKEDRSQESGEEQRRKGVRERTEC